MRFRQNVKKLTHALFPVFWVLSCSAFWPFSCVESSGTPHFLVFLIPASLSDYVPAGGHSVSLKGIGIFSDGIQQDLTPYLTWKVSDSNLGSVDSNSVFTSSASGGAGVVELTAVDSFSGMSSDPLKIKVVGRITSITTPALISEAYYRPNSHEVWAISQVSGGGVYIIDTKTFSILNILTPPGGRTPGRLTFLPDGSKAYLSTSTSGAIFAIDAESKTFGSVFPTNTDSVHLASTPDGSSVFYCETSNSAHVKGIYKINTSSDTETLFDQSLLVPTGVTVGSSGKLYASDGGHSGGAFVYLYPDYRAGTSFTTFQLDSWMPDELNISPDGSYIFAVGSTAPPNFLVRTSDQANAKYSSDYGPWSFFSDNERALWARKGSSVFSIVKYRTSTLQVLDTLSYEPAGRGAITSDQVLFLPSVSPNRIEVYQYH